MKSKQVLLFLIFIFTIHLTTSQTIDTKTIIKNNFAFIYYNDSGEFAITIRSLSLNGWTMFGISKYNNSLQSGLVYMSYISSELGIFQTNRYVGTNSTSLQPTIYLNDTILNRVRFGVSMKSITQL